MLLQDTQGVCTTNVRACTHEFWFVNGVCLCALSLIGNVHIDRTVGSDKEIFMRLFPVLYIEAGKSPKSRKFSIQYFYDVKKWKKGECSASLYISKLIRAENKARFLLNPLCVGVKEGCLPHDKNNSDKTVHFAARTSLDKNLKNQSGALHFRFSLFCTIKENLFSTSIHRAGRSVYKD